MDRNKKRDFSKKTYLFDISLLVLQVIPKNILMIGPTGN
jgi:ATP-dependent protease HslVU (ClpYQ) ATPase subunit